MHADVVHLARPFVGKLRISTWNSAFLFGGIGKDDLTRRRHRRKMRQVMKLIVSMEVVLLQEARAP